MWFWFLPLLGGFFHGMSMVWWTQGLVNQEKKLYLLLVRLGSLGSCVLACKMMEKYVGGVLILYGIMYIMGVVGLTFWYRRKERVSR